MIMVPCMFVYAMSEFGYAGNCRPPVRRNGQTKKQTQNLTLKWTFLRFWGVRELRFKMDDAVTAIVTNLNPELWKILRLPRGKYESYYV